MTPEIDIILATYNGEKYLNQQIDSIINQTTQNWQILIRDDGSTDNTLNILNTYIAKYPDKIKLIKDENGNLGPAHNFEALLNSSKSQYIMFCDQDDFWLPNKIEITIKAMQDAEQSYSDLPILVHTDLILADETLKPVFKSFWEVLKVSPEKDFALDKLIYRNTITGSAIMINKKAKDLVLPFPPQVRLHDWWMAVNIAKKGKIINIPVATVLYRQHSKNVIGTRKFRKFSIFPQRLFSGIRNLFNDYRLVKTVCPSANLFTLLITNIRLFIARRFS